MRIGGETSALTVRDVVERHDGEFWFERERVRHAAFFRFLLPLASSQERRADAALDRSTARAGPSTTTSTCSARSAAQADELADRRLADLAYTVFDTETTGLEPSGRRDHPDRRDPHRQRKLLRRQESFEQLVDPQRTIPEAGIPIHGITPAMVEGQPTIGEVLPAFHAFAQDTVLVAHNAAFDMRFLQLKERPPASSSTSRCSTRCCCRRCAPEQESHR